MAYFVPGLSWMTALTAPGTVVACVAYSAMLGAGVAAAPPGRGRWLAIAGKWPVAELVRLAWPFGGVPLPNLAIGQVARSEERWSGEECFIAIKTRWLPIP